MTKAEELRQKLNILKEHSLKVDYLAEKDIRFLGVDDDTYKEIVSEVYEYAKEKDYADVTTTAILADVYLALPEKYKEYILIEGDYLVYSFIPDVKRKGKEFLDKAMKEAESSFDKLHQEAVARSKKILDNALSRIEEFCKSDTEAEVASIGDIVKMPKIELNVASDVENLASDEVYKLLKIREKIDSIVSEFGTDIKKLESALRGLIDFENIIAVGRSQASINVNIENLGYFEFLTNNKLNKYRKDKR